jgi:hypothetical protein
MASRAVKGQQALDEANWTSLFDGRSLDGWHTNRRRIGHGTGGRWEVRDGAIVGGQDPPGNGGLLLSDTLLGDFELSVDIRPDWGVDSGLFVRSTDDGKALQVAVDHYHGGYIGQVYGEGLGGFNTCSYRIMGVTDEQGELTALRARPYRRPEGAKLDYAVTPEAFLEAWNLDQWNRLRVRVTGQLPRIVTWLNGVKLLDFDSASYEHPRCDREQLARLVPRRGHVALQIHGGTQRWARGAKCRWRNMKFRPVAGG